MTTKKPGESQLTIHDGASPPAITNGGADVMSMMARALDYLQGENATQAVEALEKLVRLRTELEDREAKKSLFRALAAFQAECPAIVKRRSSARAKQEGSSFHYMYAPLDDILPIVRPLLTRHGLSVSWDTVTADNRILATATLYHEDGHSIESHFEVPKDDNLRGTGPQQHGSARSYAIRYALNQLLGIHPADQDNDATAPTQTQTITENQATNLQALIEEKKADRNKFLAFFKIATLSELPASRFNQAVTMLTKRRAT